MQSNEIEKKIRDIIKRNVTILGLSGIAPEEIKNTDNFLVDLGVESVGLMGFISEVEKEFGFKIGEGELNNDNLGNIQNTVEYIGKKLQ